MKTVLFLLSTVTLLENGTPSHSYRVSLARGITQCYLPPDTSEHTPP